MLAGETPTLWSLSREASGDRVSLQGESGRGDPEVGNQPPELRDS